MKITNYKRFNYLTVLVLLTLVVVAGCTKTHGLYALNKGDDVAIIKPVYGSRIIKIDDTPIDIIPDGFWAFNNSKPKYSSVSILPGPHKIAVIVEDFDNDPVFFIEGDFQKNKLYIVKFNVTDRIKRRNTWVVNVWIEDSETGKIISQVIKKNLRKTQEHMREINRHSI